MSHNFDQLLCKSSQSHVAPLTFLYYCYMIFKIEAKTGYMYTVVRAMIERFFLKEQE